MKDSVHIHTRPASREMILAVFRDSYRLAQEYDPGSEPDIPIELETTVRDLTMAFDWIRPKALGPALGESFGVEASVDEWLAVLTPIKKRALGDICDFLVARGAKLPVSQPLRIFGTECETAGAFVAIRSLLAKEGADISGLRPSSDLAAFVKKTKRLYALLLVMNKLAPGVLPEPLARHKKPELRSLLGWPLMAGILMFAVTLLLALGSSVSEWFGGPVVPDFAGYFTLVSTFVLIGVSVVGLIVVGKAWPTEHIARPGLETFGDLARAVAAYEPPTSSE